MPAGHYRRDRVRREHAHLRVRVWVRVTGSRPLSVDLVERHHITATKPTKPAKPAKEAMLLRRVTNLGRHHRVRSMLLVVSLLRLGSLLLVLHLGLGLGLVSGLLLLRGRPSRI